MFLSLQVNHLNPLFLTLELLPILLETASTSGDGRIVFVSSSGHYSSRWDPLRINPDQDSYNRLGAYADSKLFNVR